MRRTLPLLAAAAAILAGCPIPQPLPDYPAGTITPPRILVDELLDAGAVTFIPANCLTVEPSVQLTPRVVDTNTLESFEARWFVNYDYREAFYNRIDKSSTVHNLDPNALTRVLPTYTFEPYKHPPPNGTVPPLSGPPWRQPGIVRVVELVVSNGFDPSFLDTNIVGANRAAKPEFETQVHRWVFLSSDAVPCPPGN